MSNQLEVSIERTIKAPVKKVFEAWLKPQVMAQFIKPAPEMEAPIVEANPVEGGAFTVTMKVGEEQWPHQGVYKKIDRYNSLIFSWLSNHTTEDSLVTLTFSETDNGTKIHLHHKGFPSDEARNNHEGGWGRILQVLGEFSEQ